MSDKARIRASIGTTLNIGNFENMRVDISVEDTARENESASELFDRVWSFADRKLGEKVDAIRELAEGNE